MTKNIHLPCLITGRSLNQVSWFKDGRRLNIPSDGTIINNVRYRKKRNALILSRTDVRGSGSYQCFAILNSGGHKRGRRFQVIFYG